MILAWLIIILMIGGILSWIFGRKNPLAARWISLFSILIDFVLVLKIWIDYSNQLNLTSKPLWAIEINYTWIPQFGINFHLALDGLSLILIALTVFLGLLSVLISWKEINEREGFFHFNLLWILAGIVGVFTAVDLFLFYFFWEVMLIPMYFLIAIWGHENRIYASYKFFIFTQASGLLMFLAILGLYFIHGSQTGNYTFDYMQLLGTNLNPSVAFLLMLGFLIAFVVKLPAVPFHNWLPDAHTEAPTAGSVILAGLLLKTGAYGILRFVIPFFPEAAKDFQLIAFILGSAGILYGAMLAFAQTDLKRLVAYSSVSHMGFVLLGAYSFNELALQGTVMQMITHGISTGALFILVGMLQERIHTRDLNLMGGLWAKVPVMGGVGLLFALASLGLPGLGNFIAEFLVLAGSYQADKILTAVAALGLIASTIYSLRIVQKVFYGKQEKEWQLPDLNFREITVMSSLIIVIVWLGLFPQQVFDISQKSVNKILNSVENAEVNNSRNVINYITAE
jgi:NADH-quinone oxidoreductase subunit M